MKYFKTYNILKDKLDVLLNENHLRCKVEAHRYPFTLTITPDASPEGQIALFEDSDGKVSSRDSTLKLTLTLDGTEIQTEKRLVISDALMNKIKLYAKKMHYEYLHGFFAEQTADNIIHFPKPDDADTDSDHAEADSDHAESDDTPAETAPEPIVKDQPQPAGGDFAAFFDDNNDSDQ